MIYVSLNILIKSNYAWESAFAHRVRLSVGGPKDKDLHFRFHLDTLFSVRNKKQITLISFEIKKAVCKRQPAAYYLIVKITLTLMPVPARLTSFRLFKHKGPPGEAAPLYLS
jgi:hypothetical protein